MINDSVRENIDAVLWDMDGTLINSEPYWLLAEHELMARYGHTWTDADQEHCLGGPLPKVGLHMSKLAKGKESPDYFAEELVRLVAEQFTKGLDFIPGALPLVQSLASERVPMALVSASPRILVNSAVSLLPHNTFGCTISSQDVTNNKPDPECYLLAAEQLGVDITRCVVLEDSRTGITSGLASGAVVIGIPSLHSFPKTHNLTIRKNLIDLSLDEMLQNFRSHVLGAYE